MQITTDWHIHSHNSYDGNLTLADLVREADEKGITDFGVTDHFQTGHTMPDIETCAREFAELADENPRFHLGVELSTVTAWEVDQWVRGNCDNLLRSGRYLDVPPFSEPGLGMTREDMDRVGIEYVVAAAHGTMNVPLDVELTIRDHHAQLMHIATNPIVSIAGHPWWAGPWKDDDGNYTGDPWFDDFTVVPQTMHDEFASVVIENGTAVEINVSAFPFNATYTDRFKEQYSDYLHYLKERGVTFSIGSDCHDAHYTFDVEASAAWIEPLGLSDDDFWRLPPRETA
jgi:histidinol phosphatase-like PHP family hydrolase